MHNIIDALNWRYATKKFDPSKKIDDDYLEIIKECLRLVPTSFGLQSMKFLFIESKDLREKLLQASYGQQQIVDASNLLVLCTYKDIHSDHVDEYMEDIVKVRNQNIEDVSAFADRMKNTLISMSPEHKINWSSKQLYIALGQLLLTCAQLKIDATPMEGFNREQYDEILGLHDKNLTAVLVCPLGYRHVKDDAQFKEKVRKSKEDLFETL